MGLLALPFFLFSATEVILSTSHARKPGFPGEPGYGSCGGRQDI